MHEQRIEELWRFGGLVRRRRTYLVFRHTEEMLEWRGYALTWPGGDRLKFIGEVRDGRWRAAIILAGLAVLVVALIVGR